MKKLLSGNEALALGAYHAGVRVATAYPGTPSTEILENISQYEDVYSEWSTNEKVAMEVALGASYTGTRTMVSLKQVGLNVAADPFLAAATTGIKGGLVIINADDPGTHSSQGEQDNRHYAKMAKVPILEPADSQSAYDLMLVAFELSEQFDTPVMLRTTTRISHSKSVVNITGTRNLKSQDCSFPRQMQKYVMLPVNARIRHPLMEARIEKLAEYSETFALNNMELNERKLGVITSGVAYQYAKDVFPRASLLKLSMTYPLPQQLIKQFATMVDKIFVIEELDPFLEESIRAMGIKTIGKEFIPRVGELNTDVIINAAIKARLLPEANSLTKLNYANKLPLRPPLFCPGCPHSGIFYLLSSVGQRLKLPRIKNADKPSTLTITGDIGCYTLGAYPPFNALDTTACMGASIGQAIGMEKAGLGNKIVAVIGDSTFLHSGITPLIDGVYNQSKITVLILDNSTTAMTGHQDHPGTGFTARGIPAGKVNIETLVKGLGISDVKVADAFQIRELRIALRDSLERDELSVLIVRGSCAVKVPKKANPRTIKEFCNQCGICLLAGCPAIQTEGSQPVIDPMICVGDACTICEQICPKKAIVASPGLEPGLNK